MTTILSKRAGHDRRTAGLPRDGEPVQDPSASGAGRTVALAGRMRLASSLDRAFELRNQIVELNLGLVGHTLHGLGIHAQTNDDVRSEGVCGLIEAAARFDPERGVPFAAFATIYIRRRMIAWLAACSGPCWLSEYVGRNLHRLRQAARQLDQHQAADSRTLALASGISVRSVIALQPLISAPAHDATAESADDLSSHEDQLRTRTRLENLEALSKAMDVLSERERFVVTATFGLDGERCRRRREVASLLGVTHQRVSQIRTTALARLREAWRTL